MGQLAIKGHSKQGKKVIEILEMLGGINKYNLSGDTDEWFVLNGTQIQRSDSLFAERGFTLEKFLEKFPYKVGDKVCFSDAPNHYLTIKKIWWNKDCNDLECTFHEDAIDVPVKDLQPYKEETMEEKLEQITLEIPAGYEFFGINDDNKVVLTKKQLQYPQTYKECCDILKYDAHLVLGTMTRNFIVLLKLQKLLICRDAYWKIVGEQMGLGKPWEPSDTKDKYYIRRAGDEILKGYNISCVLEFPTKEMRDAFYENFKELIEQCKELL